MPQEMKREQQKNVEKERKEQVNKI